MSIIDAFREGKSIEFGNKKPQHIVTTISDIFLFETYVYKIYKSDNSFFNKNFRDLADKKNRFLFTRKDFEWNNLLNPKVYLKLRGVILNNEGIQFVEPTDEADELVIEMNKVDMSNQLIRLLVDGRISMDDCFEIGKQFGESLARLPKLVPEKTAYEDFLVRYEDFIPWVKSVKEISQDKAEKYLVYMKDFIENHRGELNVKSLMGVCVDGHADNAVFIDKTLLLIDTFAPKEAWLFGYKFINIYRIATDVYVFLGKPYFEKVLEGYQKATGEILPRDYDKFMIIYSELIMWPYQYMLAKQEPWRLTVAKKHEVFLEEMFRML